ncbi:MAG: hypothetical protein Kow0042_10370 [Calditrichia bacterium]
MIKDTERKNILVVDDDEFIVSLLVDYFTELGYGVTSAYNAEEAIAKLNNGNKFNLVLTDVNLPGRSGLELLKIINETKEDLPVILLTGLKTLDTAISAVKCGAEEFITKPFDLKTIRKIVEKSLKKQNRSLKKEKIYENLQHLKVSFKFKTNELDPGLLAKEIAGILNKMQFSNEEEMKQYELAFTETLINGIEHGNLELPSSIKGDDFLKLAEFEELKESRINDPEYANRHIHVIFECNPERFTLTIGDEGPGFDWRPYLDSNHKITRVNTNPYGRGFMLIRHIIDEVHFNEKGNQVTLIKNRNHQ